MRKYLKSIVYKGVEFLSAGWAPYSRLILAGDKAGWILDWEVKELKNIANHLGIKTASRLWEFSHTPQSIFLASQFFLADDQWLNTKHNIGFSYFHGLPGSGDQQFDAVYSGLVRNHERISRIQVSHSEMFNAVLQSGIEPAKVHMIPIGINLSFFQYRDPMVRQQIRKRFDIPPNAFVVGSFQKDGVGWDEGDQPKLIKGPDIFLKTLEIVRRSNPNIFVLLTGPARGYVKTGLRELGIPYKHTYLKNYPDIGPLFNALDLYLVSSRQEGGPKAILESMAAGVPLVTTSVGQAMDLVRHGENGWLAPVEDIDELAHWVNFVYQNQGDPISNILLNGRKTAEINSYDAQVPLWKKFMEGYVQC
jgi:glycosyltransferase involved in cell wall biosynthesis